MGLNLGSASAFSNRQKTTSLSMSALQMRSSNTLSTRRSNFSGVSLLRIAVTCRRSLLISVSSTGGGAGAFTVAAICDIKAMGT